MDLVPGFLELLQPMRVWMYAPTFQNLMILVSGWIFAGQRTVTGLLRAALVRRHHSSFHRVFANAAWSLDRLGLAWFDALKPWLGEDVVFLALDDTLARKRGMKVFGAGMHLDPIISTRKTPLMRWGHSWVVLGVLLEFPLWPGRWFCLPILFRLYLNSKSAERDRTRYRTRPELAVAMLHVLAEHEKTRRFHVVADSAYGGVTVAGKLPERFDLTSRVLLDARLHAPAPPRRAGTSGRPRRRGRRLPSPRTMLEGRCRRMTCDVYGRKDSVRWAEAKCRLYKLPDRPVKVVAVEPLTGGRTRQAFYSTDADASAQEILERYARRWAIEQTFRDAKSHLGFEDPQGWSRRAVRRTAPLAMLVYGWIVVWFVRDGHRSWRPRPQSWHPHKPHASLRDMLNALRLQTVRRHAFETGVTATNARKLLETLENIVQLAA
jgi:SRSO17 transposase